MLNCFQIGKNNNTFSNASSELIFKETPFVEREKYNSSLIPGSSDEESCIVFLKEIHHKSNENSVLLGAYERHEGASNSNMFCKPICC